MYNFFSLILSVVRAFWGRVGSFLGVLDEMWVNSWNLRAFWEKDGFFLRHLGCDLENGWILRLFWERMVSISVR